MTDELLLRLGGLYCLGLGVFHLTFWKIFDWSRDLKSLSFINRAVMQVLNLSLTFGFVIFAVISLAYTEEMLTTSLGRALLFLIAAFWFWRAVQQIIFFGLRRWASVAFFVGFLIGGVVYCVPWLRGVLPA